ncbi:related to short-chain dehydrogenase [Phialocephala subalpina]|uniref:Related to short-chain dehydrogenase n=1 Tax=Phialocephala subalpina TaxID=576137 RepID=A0A1L7X9F7_9HELO|nr:related to short-chain dehydrogenase [Phialocephala subalpina]
MSLLPLLIQPFRTLHLPPQGSFASQTVIVTGANTGLGLETARHIVALGAAKVILGVRSLLKGNAAKTDIETTTRRPGAVEVWELNLESFDSVKMFASRAAKLPKLDTAIMNAGLASAEWNLSPHGFERTIQVNVLSTSLLSLLLLPMMVKTKRGSSNATPHLVILGSDIHELAKFEERKAANILEALNDESLWKEAQAKSPVERYSVSKLLDFYLTTEIAKLVPTINGEPAVIVDVVAPGFCKSELLSREPGAPAILVFMQWLTARTLPEGSKTIVDAAVGGKEFHGKYLDHQKIRNPGVLVTSDEGVRVGKKVWGEILQVLMAVAPQIGRVTSGDL